MHVIIIYIYPMEGKNLALRDMIIIEIQSQKKNKEKELSVQFKDVKERSVNNEYLRDVLEDYKLYYRKILEQKQKQQDALKQILYYLEGINQGQERNLSHINEDGIEQQRLLGQISKVKAEIDEIIMTLDE
jgi:hypothetical protein